ncbi:MAG: permease [Spirochaetales bacterium]|nr:permease [Spirochaetales bacterium]
MYFLYGTTALAVTISLLINKGKTIKAIKMAYKKLAKISPAFLGLIIVISFVLYLVPEEVISKSLGNDNKFISILLASFIGSITLLPGPIAYPLGAVLLNEGVTYMVLSAFTTTLMMVGILTFPIEKAYFGTKVTIARNLLSFFIAIIVALMTGIFFGELI